MGPKFLECWTLCDYCHQSSFHQLSGRAYHTNLIKLSLMLLSLSSDTVLSALHTFLSVFILQIIRKSGKLWTESEGIRATLRYPARLSCNDGSRGNCLLFSVSWAEHFRIISDRFLLLADIFCDSPVFSTVSSVVGWGKGPKKCLLMELGMQCILLFHMQGTDTLSLELNNVYWQSKNFKLIY